MRPRQIRLLLHRHRERRRLGRGLSNCRRPPIMTTTSTVPATRLTLVVCERSGGWAVALRQALSRHTAVECRLVETRKAADCRDALRHAPHALVALALTQGTCDDMLGLLAEIGKRWPTARAIVLADRDMTSYEWLA